MFNRIKNFLAILRTGICAKIYSAKSIAEYTISAYARASGLRVFGSPLFYLRSERVIRIDGKKITILGFDVPAMVKDGFYQILDCGGFAFALGDVIMYDINNETELDKNDFGFFLAHEIGHVVHGDTWSTWRNVLLGKTEQNEGLYIDSKQEIAADQYAIDDGFEYPDFERYLRNFYARCGLPSDYITKVIGIAKETHKERFSLWRK